MIEHITPSVGFVNNNIPHKSKRAQDAAFSYDSVLSDIAAKKSGDSVKINEEYEKSVFESVEKRAAVSAEPTYSLSKSEAEYLSEKYDLDNMPQNSAQEREFLNELASMNVISKQDAELFNFNCGGTVESVSYCVSVTPFDENNPSALPAPMWEDCYNDYDNIIDRLTAIINTQNNISKYYADKCGDIRNAKKCDLDSLTDSRSFMLSKQKMLSVLQSISEKE